MCLPNTRPSTTENKKGRRANICRKIDRQSRRGETGVGYVGREGGRERERERERE